MGTVLTVIDADPVAMQIGEAFRNASENLVASVLGYIEVGRQLKAKKASLPYGAWEDWLKRNQNSLGFSDRTAQRFLRLARTDASVGCDEIEATALLSKLWGHDPRGTFGTGENEWFTPLEHIERARAVLGDIDLDPATHPAAQELIKAKQYFTETDDGLAKLWHGRVWLNPPYAQPKIQQFTEKLINEVIAQRTTAAISLTHNYTDTEWCQTLLQYCKAACFTSGRIKFEAPNGEIAAPTQGQVFCYFGNDVPKFFEVFRNVGLVLHNLDDEMM